jgi:hypothetical protein
MAFLGGLMSGTTGAFIRGSLDTATDLIQAKAVREEEDIQERVQGFGAKKKAYDTGIAEYSKESKEIDNIAQVLSMQDDDFLKDASPDELNSIARNLITLSGGKDPIDFYLKRRDDLNIKRIKPKVDVATPQVTQTDAALAEANTQDNNEEGFTSFLGTLFGGRSENSIEKATMKKLGVTKQQYDAVMAGKMPTRAPLSAGVTVAPTDKLEKIINKNSEAVGRIITTQEFLKIDNLVLPDNTTVTGKQFAGSLIKAEQAYAESGEGGEALIAMQNFALTALLPDDAKGLFKDVFGPQILKIQTALANPLLPQKQADRLQNINDQIVDAQVASRNPGSNNATNLKNVQSLINQGLGIARLVPKEAGKLPLQAQFIDESIKDLLGRSNSTSATAPQLKDDVKEEVYGLRSELRKALDSDDVPSALTALAAKVKNLSATAFQPASTDDKPTTGEINQSLMFDIVKKMPEFQGYNNKELNRIAGQMLLINPKGVYSEDEFGTFVRIPPKPDEDVGQGGKVYLKTLLPGGGTTSGTGKQFQGDADKMAKNNADFSKLARLYKGVEDNPLVFTAFGAMTVGGQTYADIAGHLSKTRLGTLYRDYFNAAEQAEIRREAISLVGSAKDRLFDDPRLSDQDLKLVLKYIAVLGEDGSGMGTGSTAALAALHGLQIALLRDNAARLYRSKGFADAPDTILPVNHKGGKLMAGSFYKDGKFVSDGSMASTLYQQIALAYGIPIESKDSIAAMSQQEEYLYGKKVDMIMAMTDAALEDVKTHYVYGKAGRPQRANLMDMGTVNDSGVMVIDGVEYTVQKLEDVRGSA